MAAAENIVVTLRIEGTDLSCDRYDLIQNSDYFKAMFEDGFAESTKSVIPIHDVALTAVKTILKIIWDREHIVEVPIYDLSSVLEAACMLQFLEVKQMVVERLEESVNSSNCLHLWTVAERLDIQSLHYRAKLFALMDFKRVRDEPSFLSFNSEEVISYLSHVNLYCPDEFELFRAVERWYCNTWPGPVVLQNLLGCINFSNCQANDVRRMFRHGGISTDGNTREILDCIIRIKEGASVADMRTVCVHRAYSLLGTKHRNLGGFPCIFVQNVRTLDTDNQTVYYYDNFKRKRKYSVLNENPTNECNVFYIDTRTNALKELFNVDGNKIDNLGGYKMLGYKYFVFLFGGQFNIGTTNEWSCNFHIYNILDRTWCTQQMPFRRRHFSACIVDNLIYIVGGTGPMRVLQNNYFYYNIDTGTWSKEKQLPHCQAHLQLQCCRFQNNLFILDTINNCGYLLSDGTVIQRYQINDPRKLLPTYSDQWTVFGHRSFLYIKMDQLYELYLHSNQFRVSRVIQLKGSKNADSISPVQSVICNDVLYCLSQQDGQHGKHQTNYSLETLKLDLRPAQVDVKRNHQIFNNRDICKRNVTIKLFGVFHPHLINIDERIL